MDYTKMNCKERVEAQIIHVANAEEGGKKVFELIKEGVNDGAKVLGLVAGGIPGTLYREMTASNINFAEMASVNLDEYVGLGGEDEQSYRYFTNKHLFDKKPFKKAFVPNGKAEDLDATSAKYEKTTDAHPVDIQISGTDQNGHIGFSESSIPLDSLTHVVELTEPTINANKCYFDKVEGVPTHAVSMRIGSVMKGKKVILTACDEMKAGVVKGVIDGPVTADIPVSALRNHQDVVVIIDDAVASKL